MPENIAMVSISTPEIQSYAWPAEANKRRYCARHSYRFIGYRSKLDARPAAWSKIVALRKIFEEESADWIFWLDADALVANFDIRVESLLDGDADLIISRDENGINSGSFFLRRNQRAAAFLGAIDAMAQYAEHRWWEQAAMMECLRRGDPPIKVRHLPQRTLNARASGAEDEAFQPGDFICHFPAMSLADRAAAINKHLLGTEFRNREQLISVLERKCPSGLVGAEVGVFRGNFSRILLDGYDFGRFYCIDSWRHLSGQRDISNTSDEIHEQNYEAALRLLSPHLYHVTILRALSSEAAARFSDESLDFVYIDADHSYRGCREDLRAFYPKVKPGGIFAGHDYLDGSLPEADFGVKSAVDEFCLENSILDLFVSSDMWPSWLIRKGLSAASEW